MKIGKESLRTMKKRTLGVRVCAARRWQRCSGPLSGTLLRC